MRKIIATVLAAVVAGILTPAVATASPATVSTDKPLVLFGGTHFDASPWGKRQVYEATNLAYKNFDNQPYSARNHSYTTIWVLRTGVWDGPMICIEARSKVADLGAFGFGNNVSWVGPIDVFTHTHQAEWCRQYTEGLIGKSL